MKYFYDSWPLCVLVSCLLVVLDFFIKLDDIALLCASFDLMPMSRGG